MRETILTCIVALIVSSAAQAQEAVIFGFFNANDYGVVEFSVGEITAPTYLDFDTFGSTNDDGTTADTEILLFSGLGPTAAFLFDDDDGASGFFSSITLGAGAGAGVHDGDLFSGEDGDLAAGNYTLVIGGFSTTAVPGGTLQDFIDRGDFGNEAVNFTLNVFTNDASFTHLNAVPEPTSGLLLAGGMLGFLIRRRR